ncbi:hypothetical protein [Shewanella sp. OMA3-2]|uniref:hypothetical protein n=1 Tax=Shewanella sp. OMA3-2 TaxID=2908650 RepID=UPI001F34FECF|nr:hypothetical protein [Shewanella sp. OMA3-2]UJF20806.1 hypothetical protein L0B17_11545 [Shewanella sp. OMA3-2]
MSSIKEHFFDIQSQQADVWIRERLNDDSLDENSEEYQDLANDYSNYQDHLTEVAEWNAELKWYKENGSSIIHSRFIAELDALKLMVETNLAEQSAILFQLHSAPFFKMSYTYAVTLLESFLGDTLKTIISENDLFLNNAISNFKILKSVKLSELSDTNLDVNSLVIKKVSEVLFHNIPNVIEMFQQVLSITLDIDISKVVVITKLRHDIAHRNGRTIDGEYVHVSAEDLLLVINEIKQFSGQLQEKINVASAA